MSAKKTPKLVLVGRITKAHGVRGELALNFFAESPDILTGEVFLRKKEGSASVPMRVKNLRGHYGSMLLTLEGVTDRSAAELLRGADVFVQRDKLPAIDDEEEAYLADMLGLEVLVQNGAEVYSIGHIESIDAPAGQELWEIITPDGREVLLPAVPEFVLDIDLDNEQVVISPPPGLLELYLGEKD